ncbi:hypothetical protein [Parasitella parasitica]|uniref:Uncharacterized protein n=1 Tax=Parasitella parasitica TaxID=35722 RepID=A0A0B7N3E1_9FUNG|nr:hypothetical protein [Parasitella parasitica]
MRVADSVIYSPLSHINLIAKIDIDAAVSTGCFEKKYPSLILKAVASYNAMSPTFVPDFDEILKSVYHGTMEFNLDDFKIAPDPVSLDDKLNGVGDESVTNEVELVDYNMIPHFEFARSHGPLCRTYLLFPRLYILQRKKGQNTQQSRKIYIDLTYVRQFINEYFLAAAKALLSLSAFNRLEVSYEFSPSI